MIKINSCELDKVIGITSKIPKHMIEEYVLCGRSNVGKSAFINAICNRKNYAHTSIKSFIWLIFLVMVLPKLA